MSALWHAGHGPYLALYLATLALHAVFVSYLVGGTAFVLAAHLARAVRGARGARGDDAPASPLAAQIASWLPLSMGAAITAGVAPLLFLQILYQRAFYTANLLLGPIWGAMIPALVLGFYLLYLHKARPALRPKLVLGLALACFTLVAALWGANHRVMVTPSGWTDAYRGSPLSAYGWSLVFRAPVWLGAMLAQFAAIAAWQARGASRGSRELRALAGTALAGRALSAAGALALGWHAQLATPLAGALLAAIALEASLWVTLASAPSGARRAVATRVYLGLLSGAAALALAAALAVRELPRLAHLRELPASVQRAGGAWLFATFAALALAILAAILRAARRALPAEPAAAAGASDVSPPA
ncbi:MAG: hypothetical protein R3B48_10160 [Kofleriaceae bacterium]